ncbi:Glyoxal reductase [Paenibacillus sp. JJ-100]|uniref:aldo/keto reductase n=1 Tax=Paenibacillus sp. JJ-100 TaxID=2974896 RepID=UPI0022FF5AA0|nr:aldo/keto reductase [Paenibacillus sp. JJ-100]CAI6041706.1 Glyoxal reductase [Paenibacillus sp. JJ-100]
MQSVTLNNGVKMPIIGFGVYQVPDPQQCENTVYEALRAGYRLIDTAAGYMNEEAVGRAIQRSGVSREELFITTKLWIQDAGYESTKKAFAKSLKKMQLEQLDMYLIHMPFGDYYGAWRAMEELYRDGYIRAIGVSNFLPDRLMDLIVHNEIVPAINQIETHPFQQQIISRAFLKEQGIQHQSWSPFAEGRNHLFTNATLSAIAEKYNKSVAQIVLRWLTQQNIVVIPKSVRKERLVENFDIFDVTLSSEDMKAIATLDTGESLFMKIDDPEVAKMLGQLKVDI